MYIGAGLGGVATIEKTHAALLEKGPRRGISPYFVPMIIVNMAPGLVSIRFGCKGPNFSHVSACSTGAHSIGEAMRAIQRGDCDAMFAGGCEATITPLGVGGFNAMRALSTRNEEPERASRPFDLGRDGLRHRRGRGRAHPRGAGDGQAARRAHLLRAGRLRRIVRRALDGAAARRGRGRAALHEDGAARRASIDVERVGYINAHGTSTKQGDIAETTAVKTVFGDARQEAGDVVDQVDDRAHARARPAGSRRRSRCWRSSAASCHRRSTWRTPDPECDLDYVPNQAREAKVDVALSNSFGFGGTNATLIFARYQGD